MLVHAFGLYIDERVWQHEIAKVNQISVRVVVYLFCGLLNDGLVTIEDSLSDVGELLARDTPTG